MTSNEIAKRVVNFTKMEDGTADEYVYLTKLYEESRGTVPGILLSLLNKMKGDPMGYQIDRYSHCLQTATRAEKDGADEETIVCALLHDVGDIIAPDNHSEVAAAILRPYISEKNYWIVRHHGFFQGYYFFHHLGKDRNARDAFKEHKFYKACIDFCENWDQCSFDPDFENYPLEYFEPMLKRLFMKPQEIHN